MTTVTSNGLCFRNLDGNAVLPVREVLVTFIAVTVSLMIWFLPESLSEHGRITLIITALAVIGWVGTKIPESIVALSAALALVLLGVVPEGRLFDTLGSDLVWLLLAAFVIAAVLKDSGLVEQVITPLTRRLPGFASLVFMLSFVIAATAFILPSTSGRAALLLPVFQVLLPLLPDARLGRALALLFPTVILLSAGSSLIGAGAHLVAVEAIAKADGLTIGYLDWMMLGAPLGFLSSVVGAALILALFVPRSFWNQKLAPSPSAGPLDARQKRVGVLVMALVGLWVSEALHGLDMTIIAVVGALVLLLPPFTSRKTKEVFRAVDVELILYMAATMLLAQAMVETKTDQWLAGIALDALPAGMVGNSLFMIAILSAIAVVAHLFITSRSARAAVLIPAVALPVAGMGHDPALVILISVMGTGFCQTMMASAKPVAIYGMNENAGFSQTDLFRLAVWLGPIKILLLIGFALGVWPTQLGSMRSGSVEVTAPVSAAAIAPLQQTSVTDLRLTEEKVALPLLAPAPSARPAISSQNGLRRPATNRTASSRVERRGIVRQIGRDFRQAGRQVGRGLRQIFR